MGSINDSISQRKQDRRYAKWSLPIRLEKVANSLLLDDKKWMAETVLEALKQMKHQRVALAEANQKITRQKENLRAYREAEWWE